MPFYLYCCNSFVEAQKAGITFMPKHGNMRLDRSQSKKQWAEYIQAGIQGFNDVHSMQNIVSLIERYDQYQLVMEQLFSRRVQVLLDKYTLEFVHILNVTVIPFNTSKYHWFF